MDAAIEWLDAHRDALQAEAVKETVRPTFSFAEPSQQTTEPSTGLSNQVSAAAQTELYNSDIRPDGLSRTKLEQERKKHADYKRQKQMDEERAQLKKKEETSVLVREKYAREKAERLAAKKGTSQSSAPSPVVSAPVVPSSRGPAALASGEAVLQVRAPGRPPLTVRGLQGSATLAQLYERTDAELGRSDYLLTMPFPPPPCHFARDDPRSLAEAGLCPRAALSVTALAALGRVVEGHSVQRGEPQQQQEQQQPVAVARVADGQDGQCQICQGPMNAGEQLKALPCAHAYHAECLDEWADEHTDCPRC